MFKKAIKNAFYLRKYKLQDPNKSKTNKKSSLKSSTQDKIKPNDIVTDNYKKMGTYFKRGGLKITASDVANMMKDGGPLDLNLLEIEKNAADTVQTAINTDEHKSKNNKKIAKYTNFANKLSKITDVPHDIKLVFNQIITLLTRSADFKGLKSNINFKQRKILRPFIKRDWKRDTVDKTITFITTGLSELELLKLDIKFPNNTLRLELNFSSYEELIKYLDELINCNTSNTELVKILTNMKNDLEKFLVELLEKKWLKATYDETQKEIIEGLKNLEKIGMHTGSGKSFKYKYTSDMSFRIYVDKIYDKFKSSDKNIEKILSNMKNDLERSYVSGLDKSPKMSDVNNPNVMQFKEERKQKRLETMQEIKTLFTNAGMIKEEIEYEMSNLYENQNIGTLQTLYKPDTYTSPTLAEQQKSLEEELSKNGKLWKKAKQIAKECEQHGEVKDMERALKEDNSPKMSNEDNLEVKEFKKERENKRSQTMKEIKELFTTNGMTDSQITANLNKLYQDINRGIVKDKYKSAMAVSPTLNGQKQSLDEELAEDGKLWKKARRLANDYLRCKETIDELK